MNQQFRPAEAAGGTGISWPAMHATGYRFAHRRSAAWPTTAIAVSLLVHWAALVILLLPNHSEPAAPPTTESVALVFEPVPAALPPSVDATPAELPVSDPPPVAAEPTPPPQQVEIVPVAPAPDAVASLPVPLPPPTPAVVAPERKPTVRPAVRRTPARAAEPPSAPAEVASTARSSTPDPVTPPRPVAGMETNQAPRYPEIARRRGEQGRVMLRVSVSADGNPLEVDVLESSGHATLNSAAQLAVRGWRFVPATRIGTPIQAVAEVPIRFRLDN